MVCGADVLESFVTPGVWVEEQVREILNDHGVVCITRYGNNSSMTEKQCECILNALSPCIETANAETLESSSTCAKYQKAVVW